MHGYLTSHDLFQRKEFQCIQYVNSSYVTQPGLLDKQTLLFQNIDLLLVESYLSAMTESLY